MHAEHENRRLGKIFQNLPRRVEAVCLGQSAVHDYDLWPQLLRQADGLITIAGFAHHLHVRLIFQHAPEPPPHQAVIID
jgi:hypothetical protein